MCIPFRAPTWFSPRRHFDQILANLSKCSDLSNVKRIHAQLLKSSNLNDNPSIAPKLITAYSIFNQIKLATFVFNRIKCPNVELYNAMIKAYNYNSQCSQGFMTFVDMIRGGVLGDHFTYPFILKACIGVNGVFCLRMVEMVHARVVKLGFLSDLFVCNGLIDGYCKCKGLLSDARRVFDEMPERDVVSWNMLLDRCVKGGVISVAMELFERMPERDVVSWSTMVSGYVKAGDMRMARVLFDKMPVKNLVAWTIIISGYAEKRLAKEAISMYDEMERAGLKLDDGTVISILSACAESGFVGLGKRVRSSIEATGFNCSVAVNNALVDMYAKCGNVKKALNVFERMKKRDVVSWNAIIHGLAMHGHGETALKLFNRMKQEGFHPDRVTFVAILCACTHMGLVEKGVDYFYAMERDYGLVPQIEHYGCLVDLLGRGGRLEEAIKVVKDMPMEPNAIIWGTLLGACRVHNAVKFDGKILKHLIKLNSDDTGSFSMLSNIYAAAGDWGNVANVRRAMKSIGVQKLSGASSIELNGVVHEFTVFDKSHPKSKGIYEMITLLHPQKLVIHH